jgi:hypothetical protein
MSLITGLLYVAKTFGSAHNVRPEGDVYKWLMKGVVETFQVLAHIAWPGVYNVGMRKVYPGKEGDIR